MNLNMQVSIYLTTAIFIHLIVNIFAQDVSREYSSY